MLHLDHHISLDKEAIQSPNLAERFGEVDRRRIGNYIYEGYQQDCQSRQAWLRRNEAAMDLALQLQKDKSFPWPGASNVTFPLITISALQFHSRAYPALVQSPDIVQCQVFAPDPDGQKTARAERVSRHMSWQIGEQDQSWEEQQDRLLISVPIVGCAFKKSYYSGKVGHNLSDLVMAKDLVVNYFAKSVETEARKTHIIQKHRNEIYQNVVLGAYCNVLECSWYKSPSSPENTDEARNKRTGQTEPEASLETPFVLLEQHVSLDLDGDGYAEPYIALIEETSHELLRLVTRFDREEDITRLPDGTIVEIRATEYFTKYGFIPSPDGGIYDLGFGILLGPLNESVNTIINQLVDAGTMQNLGGGFLGRGVKIRGGTTGFSPLEWKRVDSTGDDLRKNIVPIPANEPSHVLFQLLGLLIDYTNRISGATEMLAGQNPGQNTAATTSNQMVEQGMKIYSAIFKRMWRSMKAEFQKLYLLNAVHLSDQPGTPGSNLASRADYLEPPDTIRPAADPNVVSDAMRAQQAQILSQRAVSVPGYDIEKVERHLLKALKIPGGESLYLGPQKTGPLPNAKVQIEQIKQQIAMAKIKQEAQEFTIKMMEQHDLQEAQIAQLESMAMKLAAEAKGIDTGHQIAAINTMIAAQRQNNDALMSRINAMIKGAEVAHNASIDEGTMERMAGQSSNGGDAALSGGTSGGA